MKTLSVFACVYLVASCVAAGRSSHGRSDRLVGGGAKNREEGGVRCCQDNDFTQILF